MVQHPKNQWAENETTHYSISGHIPRAKKIHRSANKQGRSVLRPYESE